MLQSGMAAYAGSISAHFLPLIHADLYPSGPESILLKKMPHPRSSGSQEWRDVKLRYCKYALYNTLLVAAASLTESLLLTICRPERRGTSAVIWFIPESVVIKQPRR